MTNQDDYPQSPNDPSQPQPEGPGSQNPEGYPQQGASGPEAPWPNDQQAPGAEPQGYGPGPEPQGQGFDPNAPQGQGFHPNAPQGQGFDPNAPQGQGFDPNAPHGQDVPPEGYGPHQPQGFGQPNESGQKPLNLKTILGGILAIAVIGFGLWSWANGSSFPKEGECVTFKGEASDDVDYDKHDCDDKETFSYEVISVNDGDFTCPDMSAPYNQVESSGKVRKTACVIENLHPDVCYGATDADDFNSFKVVDCGETPNFKVTDRQDQADATCTEGEAVSFPDPGRTYCIVDQM